MDKERRGRWERIPLRSQKNKKQKLGTHSTEILQGNALHVIKATRETAPSVPVIQVPRQTRDRKSPACRDVTLRHSALQKW